MQNRPKTRHREPFGQNRYRAPIGSQVGWLQPSHCLARNFQKALRRDFASNGQSPLAVFLAPSRRRRSEAGACRFFRGTGAKRYRGICFVAGFSRYRCEGTYCRDSRPRYRKARASHRLPRKCGVPWRVGCKVSAAVCVSKVHRARLPDESSTRVGPNTDFRRANGRFVGI